MTTTTITRADLIPLTDPAAIACIQRLQIEGAQLAGMVGHDGHRICYSIDPSGPDGSLEQHVSVSRNGRSVPIEIASMYGRLIYPSVIIGWDEIAVRETATHLWRLS
jgi:hypothetical protein